LIVLFVVLQCAVEISSRSLADSRQLPDLLPPWLRRYIFASQTAQENQSGWRADRPTEVLNWPSNNFTLGQISGVAVDLNGNPVIFHRGETEWDSRSFDAYHRYNLIRRGPIRGKTIATLNERNGELLDHWGQDLFYMPHGLEIDIHGNTWVTDVARHQVLKFSNESRELVLALGEEFIPGKDNSHFCKPTDVAVARSGIFFVADGYCNERIMKFTPDGNLMGKIGGPFSIAHSLTLLEDVDTLCVADREKNRIRCYRAGLEDPSLFGTPVGRPFETKGAVYAIATEGHKLYSVAIPSFGRQAIGNTFNLDEPEGAPKIWNKQKGLKRPHDLAISPDGRAMYVVEIGPNRISKFVLE